MVHLPAYTPPATCTPCGILHGDAVSRNTRTRHNSGHTSHASLLHPLPPPEAGPRIGVRVTLSSFRAATRNPEYPGKNSGRTSRASLLHPLPPPEAGPRIECGVTHYVHSSLQREERTKKRRRCYRAISFGGWRRLRGLRNSLRSDSPRPHSSVGWPPPGPIKAGVPLLYTENDPDVLQHNIQGYTGLSSFRATTRNPGIPARYDSGRTNRAALLHPLPSPEAGPRIECG